MTQARFLSSVFALGGLLLLAVPASAQQPDPRNRPAPGGKVVPAAADMQLGMALLGSRNNPDGTFINSSGGTGTVHLGTGIYEVDFTRDVSACFYSASAFSAGLTIEVEPRSGNADGVFLFIENSSGTSTDTEFYLTVYCGQ